MGTHEIKKELKITFLRHLFYLLYLERSIAADNNGGVNTSFVHSWHGKMVFQSIKKGRQWRPHFRRGSNKKNEYILVKMDISEEMSVTGLD